MNKKIISGIANSANRMQGGFTLIELIVVMAILVLLSVISYRALVTALETRQVVDEYSEQLREFELGVFLLTRDLQQIQVSPTINDKLPFSGRIGQGEQQSGELFRLQRAPNATMLRGVTEVAYRLENGQLWQDVDSAQNASGAGDKGDKRLSTPILKHIDHLAVTFYDDNGKARYHWQDPTPPAVVKIILQHQRYGKLEIKERVNAP